MSVDDPKVLELTFVSGSAQVILFIALKESMRRANRKRSVMANDLTNDRSMLNRPGPVSPE
jgi:hypothetical protein